jgi:hypothetical protein
MAWLNSPQKKLFRKFLNASPPLNRHGNITTRYNCFYSSELKNLKQCIACLKQIKSGRLRGGDRSSVRYRNSLTNWGLIHTTPKGTLCLSEAGKAILDYIRKKRGPVAQIALVDIVALDSIIFAYLIKQAMKRDVEEDFARKLRNAQLFVEAIPPRYLSKTLNDLDLLYFLQIIHSTGKEVGRFFKLSERERTSAVEEFYNLLASPKKNSFPNRLPQNHDEKIVFLYLRPAIKNTIQKDIRYRLKGFLTAYVWYRKRWGRSFPRFDDDLNPVLKTTVAATKKKRKKQARVWVSKDIAEEGEDEKYQKEINSSYVKRVLPAGRIKLSARRTAAGFSRWPTDPAIAREKLSKSHWSCEINPKHKTFIAAATGKFYIEAHHFVPMSAQSDYKYSLDVPENILALCPICHRKFHHAVLAERTKLLAVFFKTQRSGLKKRGIDLSLEELKNYYAV